MADLRIEDLRESGLLWLINRTVFHPRGFALGMVYRDDGEFMYWVLQGVGSEPWEFAGDETDLFCRVEALFAAARCGSSFTSTDHPRLTTSTESTR